MAPEPSRPAHASVLRMAAPLVVSFVMRAAFTFVDTAYAAILGDHAVASIGLTVPAEFLMIAIWVGISTGLTAGLSRAMGSREGGKFAQYLRVTWVLVLCITPLFGLVGIGIWFVAPHMKLEPEVTRAFQIYGTTLICGSALTTFWSILPDSIVKAHHDTRSTMWAGIWSNVINVSLNTLFLFVFHWGVFGIALSTVIGRLGGLVYALIRASRHERRRAAAGTDDVPGLDPSPYRTVLGLAVPSSLTFVLMATETAIVNFLLAKLPYPTEGIAAYSIYYRITLFALNPVIAGGVAMLPYAARRFGEGDIAGARRGLRDAGLVSVLYSIALLPLMLWGAPHLAGWLAESPVTGRYATFALRFVPLACLLGAPFLLCRPVFEAMGRGRPGLAMALLRYVLLTAPAAWLGMQASLSLGQPGIYGMVVGLLVSGGITSGLFLAWVMRTLGSMPLTAAAMRPLDSTIP